MSKELIEACEKLESRMYGWPVGIACDAKVVDASDVSEFRAAVEQAKKTEQESSVSGVEPESKAPPVRYLYRDLVHPQDWPLRVGDESKHKQYGQWVRLVPEADFHNFMAGFAYRRPTHILIETPEEKEFYAPKRATDEIFALDIRQWVSDPSVRFDPARCNGYRRPIESLEGSDTAEQSAPQTTPEPNATEPLEDGGEPVSRAEFRRFKEATQDWDEHVALSIDNLCKRIVDLEKAESHLSEEAVYEGTVCSTNGGRTFFFGLYFKDYPRAKHLPHGTKVYISTKKPIRFEEEA